MKYYKCHHCNLIIEPGTEEHYNIDSGENRAFHPNHLVLYKNRNTKELIDSFAIIDKVKKLVDLAENNPKVLLLLSNDLDKLRSEIENILTVIPVAEASVKIVEDQEKALKQALSVVVVEETLEQP